MATLTKSTGTVTLSNAVEKVSLPAVYGWVWVKNMSDGDMFVGLSDGISAGADGVMRIPAGECGRVQTDGQDSVYLIGSGNALVVAQNYADCPFKVGGKGGEIPDLSAYAKTADVPNIKVNAAVNADKIEGFPAQKLFCQRDNLASKDLNDCVELGSYFFNGINANGPTSNGTISAGAYAVVDNIIYNKDFIKQTCQFIHGGSAYLGRMFVRYYDMMLACWSEWKEIYTEASKPYITGSVTVAANSDVCVTNHGFTPSAVIWWDGSSSGVAVSFSSTQFTMSLMSTSDRTVNYLIFK